MVEREWGQRNKPAAREKKQDGTTFLCLHSFATSQGDYLEFSVVEIESFANAMAVGRGEDVFAYCLWI